MDDDISIISICRDKIETFIDENKALMKRMYGAFEAESEYGSALKQGKKRKRMLYDEDFLPDLEELWSSPGDLPNPENVEPTGDSFFNKIREKRQSQGTSRARNQHQNASSNNSGAKTDTGR